MKLLFSDPVVVSMGPDSRTAGWGPYQFPNLFVLDDGRLVYTFNVGADSETAYGSEPGCYVSADGGRTWSPRREKDFSGKLGVKLPNGDRLAPYCGPSIPLDGLKLPKPIGSTWLGHTIYLADEIDCCETTWSFIRANAESPEGRRELAKVNQPYFMVRSCQGVLVPPSPRGRLRIAPDGALWMPHYYLAGTNPGNGGFIPYLCNYLFRSTDMGRTWDLMSWLPYVPDTDIDPLAFFREGYGENDLAFAPDGSMIRLIRTDGCYPRNGPCYLTRSVDGGRTWSPLERFDDHGVWPCLLALPCGITLAAYGRPGLQIRATGDPACLKWEPPVEWIHSDGRPESSPRSVLAQGTCGYTNMVALNDRTAAVAYSDFRIPDEQGVPRKCMMFRTITVE